MSFASEQSEPITKKVLDHHLGAFAHGVDELLKDYDDDSAIVTPEKTFRGREEIAGFFKAFLESADPTFWPAFKITSMSTTGAIAYMAWEARPWVTLATDTLYIKDGKISVQTFTSFPT
ncbi:nuclear transport factor 2 family protein [Paraburkholderia diazotrophica]|uniref:nuclear transport factor 2 family protein n=1 Tax=Paraburkholderia diazotrophica TaxID=667676 RepID=UPI00316CF28B